MTAKKKSASKKKKLAPDRYRGFYLHVTAPTTTKNKKKLFHGQLLLAIGDVGSDGYVPIAHLGRIDHVKQSAVERVV
jgi:hypothetical protein